MFVFFLSVDGYQSCFYFWALKIMQLQIFIYMSFGVHVYAFPVDIYLKVELLDRKVWYMFNFSSSRD